MALFTGSVSLGNEIQPRIQSYISQDVNKISISTSVSSSYRNYINRQADEILESIGANDFFEMINREI
jgi:hypothetical protein